MIRLPTGNRYVRRSAWLLLGTIAALLVYGALTVALVLNRSSNNSIGPTTALVVATGNLSGETDRSAAVAEMLSRHNFDALLTLGDHAYLTGSGVEFADLYAPRYGAFDDRVRPTPGDHDYATPDAAAYFDYFERKSPTFSGDPYYTFSLGTWRIYSLNSEIGQSRPGGDMYEWLRSNLSENPADCVLAYWHKPMFTVGAKDNDEGDMELIWNLLAAHGADVVLAAHDDNYQRWAPIDGITSFVVGTGGRSRSPVIRDDEAVAVTDDEHDGALELALGAQGASFAFRSVDDQVLDSGDVSCSKSIPAAPPPEAPSGLHVESQADGATQRLTWDPPPNARGVIGYVVRRGSDAIGFTANTSFKDTSLSSGGRVVYSVRAVNSAGLRSPASPPAPSGGEVLGFSGSVWSALDRNPDSPTIDKPQSKLWFADGRWWGILFTDGAAHGVASGYYIHRFDADAQAMTNTGVAVDERDRSHADALWDEASQRLYVVSTIDSGAIKVYRYDYSEGEYSATPGFPVRLTPDGAESATIAKGSDGLLWVTFTQAADGPGRCVADKACVVRVMHSTSSDSRWTTPSAIPVDGAEVSVDDLSSVVAYGGRVGVAWSNQLEGSFRFASHVDGDPDSAWTAETLVVSPRAADDHLNVKSDSAGRVYLVGKTSLNDPADAPAESPLITVWVRETDGRWRSATAWTASDDATRPQLIVDPTLGRVVVVAAAPGAGGAIYHKSAPISSLDFEPGLGTPLMLGGSMNNPTTTKQPVDLTNGALVLAGESDTHTYWHGTVTDTP